MRSSKDKIYVFFICSVFLIILLSISIYSDPKIFIDELQELILDYESEKIDCLKLFIEVEKATGNFYYQQKKKGHYGFSEEDIKDYFSDGDLIFCTDFLCLIISLQKENLSSRFFISKEIKPKQSCKDLDLFKKSLIDSFNSSNIYMFEHDYSVFERYLSNKGIKNYFQFISEISAILNKCNLNSTINRNIESINYSGKEIYLRYYETKNSSGDITSYLNYNYLPEKENLKYIISDKLLVRHNEIRIIDLNDNLTNVFNKISKGSEVSIRIKIDDFFLRVILINDSRVATVDSYDSYPSISVDIDYDDFYSFLEEINSRSRKDDNINKDGFMQSAHLLSAASKFWRTGITISPRYKMMHILFNLSPYIFIMQVLL